MKQPDDRSRRRFLKASSIVGSGSRIQPGDDRRGICRFAIQNYSKGGHHDPK